MADQGCLEGADQVEALFYSFSFQLDFDSSEGIKCLSGLWLIATLVNMWAGVGK